MITYAVATQLTCTFSILKVLMSSHLGLEILHFRFTKLRDCAIKNKSKQNVGHCTVTATLLSHMQNQALRNGSFVLPFTHNKNMPLQYTEIFLSCKKKNENFQ